MNDFVVEVKNLYKIFGDQPQRVFPMLEKGMSKSEILEKTGCTVAIDDANFQVKRAETFVIMGLSGSGKSTIIRCLNRLIEPTRGQVCIYGDDIMQMNKEKLREIRRTKMSMVFQNFGLFPHRTVLKNVEYGLEISGVEKDKRKEAAEKALDQVGLKGYENSMPDELSGGMKQRVGLARALANEAEILLMDEAFSALDPLIRMQMQDELIELQNKVHKTIIFITHDLDEALKLGDRIAILGEGGQVKQIGTSEEILTNPADEYVKTFVQNVDRTKVITASTIMRKPVTVNLLKEGPASAIRKMEQIKSSTLYVVDGEKHLKGIIRIDDVVKLQKEKSRDLESILITEVPVTAPDTFVSDLLNYAIEAKLPLAVLDDENRLLGIVDRAMVIAEVSEDDDSETGNEKVTTYQEEIDNV